MRDTTKAIERIQIEICKLWEAIADINKHQSQVEPHAEPKQEPAKEQFKVGDWVEVECQNGTKKWTEQCTVICIYRDGDGYGVNFHGDHQPVTYDGEPFSLHLMGFVRVIRKLDPSEVRVRITLEGQVTKPVGNAGGRFWLYYSTDEYVSIELDALSHKDRELVESLLKAQEEK